VFQIKGNQNPARLEMKDTASIYKALEIYDVHDIYVELESLQERGLKPGDLMLPVREIYRKDVNSLMRENDIINGS
jgi:tRNA 2-thiouridine synthesizing protein C